MKGLNYKSSARHRRKFVVEDISVGTTNQAVKVFDHDGTLREAEPGELQHRHQLHNGGRRK